MENWILPEGWGWNYLKELCRFVSGGTPSTSKKEYFSGTIPWITGADILDDKIAEPRHYITEEAIQNSATNMVASGNLLLVTRTGVGKVAITDRDICISQDFTGLIPDKNRVDVRYLYRYLQSRKHYFVENQRGATIKGVTREVVANLEVFLPYPDDPARSLAEQRRIVARLEALLSEVRDMRDLLQSMRRDWSALMESALVEVFEALEDATPEPIGAIADVKGGKRLPKGDTFSEEMTPFPYIRVTDFSNYSVDTSNLRFLKPETFQRIRQYIISKDDIYISIAGTIGLVGTIPPELDGVNLTENAAKLVFKEKFRNRIDKKYVVYYLSSAEGKKQIEERAKAAGQPKLALERIKSIEIPIPYPDDPARSLSEQRRIVAYLEAVQEEVSAARRQVEEDERRVTQLEQSILAAAFRGEV